MYTIWMSKTLLFLTIQFSISILSIFFLPIDRTISVDSIPGNRVDQGTMTIKLYSAFPKAQKRDVIGPELFVIDINTWNRLTCELTELLVFDNNIWNHLKWALIRLEIFLTNYLVTNYSHPQTDLFRSTKTHQCV